MVCGIRGFIVSPLRLTGHVNRAYYGEWGGELFRRLESHVVDEVQSEVVL